MGEMVKTGWRKRWGRKQKAQHDAESEREREREVQQCSERDRGIKKREQRSGHEQAMK